jgi:uncharacterized repeat protein (TIGR02543 family)
LIRTGYTFGGWWTEPNGTGLLVTSATVVSNLQDHTLHAKWTPNSYTVNLDAAGGAVAPENLTVFYDSAYGALPIPTREIGYVFDGWWSREDDSGHRIDSETIISSTENHTLYARWWWQGFVTVSNVSARQIPGSKTVEIKYDVVSSETDIVTVNLSINKGTEAVACPSVSGDIGANVPTGESKSIIWDGGAGCDDDLATLTLSIHVEALPEGSDPSAVSWEVVNERWIKNTYANGHSTMSDLLTTNMWIYSISQANIMPRSWGSAQYYCGQLSYAGYSDWILPDINLLQSQYSQRQFFPDQQYRYCWSSTHCPNDNRKVYAFTFNLGRTFCLSDSTERDWWPVRTRQEGETARGIREDNKTIVLDIDFRDYVLDVFSEYGNSLPEVGTHTYAWNATVSASVEAQTDGHTCTGWIGTGSVPEAGDTNATGAILLTEVASSIEWQWAGNPYTVTFDSQGGTVPDPASKGVTFGAAYGTLATTTREEGYTFAGWWTGAGGTGKELTAATLVTTADNHTLYAKWTANSYTITFDSQGGTTPDPASKEVTFDSAYGALATTTRTGYMFSGWWTGEGGTGTEVSAESIVATLGDHKLYAKWAEFDPNDGLVLHYPMNGDANDASGNHNHGIVTGATIVSNRFDNPDSAYGFDGTAYIKAQNNPDVDPYGDFTYAFWIRIDSLGGFADGLWYLDRNLGENDTPLIGFVGASPTQVNWYVRYNNNTAPPSGNHIRTGQLDLDVWKHYVITREYGAQLITYENGAIVSSVGDNALALTPQRPVLGSHGNASYERKLIGAMDDFRIYNRALSSGEVAQLYALGSPPATHTVTLHPGAHGRIAEANEGASLVTHILHGGAFPTVTVEPDTGYNFTGWDPHPPDKVTSAFTATALYEALPGSFGRWMSDQNLSGEPVEVFQDICPVNGSPYGFLYAFGGNLMPDMPLIVLRVVNGLVLAEIPAQDPSTAGYVIVRVEATDDLSSGEWNVELVPVAQSVGSPSDRARYHAPGTQRNLFFRLVVRLPDEIPIEGEGFVNWAAGYDLCGDLDELFSGDRNADGIANAFDYAFGEAFPDNSPLLNIRMVDGAPVAEIPVQDVRSMADVRIVLEATTDLTSGFWDLPVYPAPYVDGKPANRQWYAACGGSQVVYFRLRAERIE